MLNERRKKKKKRTNARSHTVETEQNYTRNTRHAMRKECCASFRLDDIGRLGADKLNVEIVSEPMQGDVVRYVRVHTILLFLIRVLENYKHNETQSRPCYYCPRKNVS